MHSEQGTVPPDFDPAAHRVHEIEVLASPEEVFAKWHDVEGWPSWNAGVEAIDLHGPFQEGTTFMMKLPGSDEIVSRLIAVDPPFGFVDETMVGATRVTVDHHCEAKDGGRSVVTYATTVSGPDAAEICDAVSSDFPDVLAALKLHLER